jgi:hypothetical protein
MPSGFADESVLSSRAVQQKAYIGRGILPLEMVHHEGLKVLRGRGTDEQEGTDQALHGAFIVGDIDSDSQYS